MNKQLLSFLLILLMSMVGTKTLAYDIAVANTDGVTIYYDWINNNTELAVSYSNEYSGNVVIPSSVEYNGKTYSVTCIDRLAFSKCSGLTSVTIPNSVIYIGWDAFSGCSGLSSVTIGNSVEEIDENAFSGCYNLTSISIPNSVKLIYHGAFAGCYGLNTIIVEDGNAVFDSRNNCNAIIRTSSNSLEAGCKNTKIPNSVICIDDHAFYGISNLTSIEIPNSITTIKRYAFGRCSNLTSIKIPYSVTSVDRFSFYSTGWYNSQPDEMLYIDNCLLGYKEEKISGDYYIKEGTRIIAGNAFRDCSDLTSVTIPNSVTNIGEYAFQGCI